MDRGKLSESALKRSVLKYVQLNNKVVKNDWKLLLGSKVGVDAAVLGGNFQSNEQMTITTQTSIGRHRKVVVEALGQEVAK